MKRILLCILFNIQINFGFAQITFEKAYRTLPDIEVARSCEIDEFGGYIVAAGEKSINTALRVNSLYKINAYGDTDWVFTYSINDDSNFQFVRKTKDGNYYIAGIRPDSSTNNDNMWWIIKVDSTGNFVWKKNYAHPLNDFYEEGNTMKIRNDGSIFFYLYNGKLMTIDDTGILDSIRLNYNFHGDPHSHLKKNLIFADSLFYYLGYYGTSLPFRIMKTNYNADTINSIVIATDTGRFVLDLLKKNGNNFLTCSFAQPLINGKHPFTLSKFDSTGAKVWSKFYNFLSYSSVIPTTYTTLANGTNIVSIIPNTNGFDPPTGRAAIFCFNDNGDSLWYKKLSPSDVTAKTEIFDVIATPDSGLLAVGQILFSNGQQKSYLVKLDANGNLFNGLSILEKKRETYLHLYPNPSNSYTSVHYMGSEKNPFFTITNLQGQIIYSQKLQSNDERIIINTTKFNPGFYLCKINSEGKLLANRKLIITK